MDIPDKAVQKTDEFEQWFRGLKDETARNNIIARVDRLAQGNPGDFRQVRPRVWELRFSGGPGYRVYYTERGRVIILLLLGGSKGTQEQDIEKAYQLSKSIQTEIH